MSDLFAASKALLRKAMPEKPMTPDQFAEQVADVVEPFIVARIDAEVNAALDRLAAEVDGVIRPASARSIVLRAIEKERR